MSELFSSMPPASASASASPSFTSSEKHQTEEDRTRAVEHKEDIHDDDLEEEMLRYRKYHQSGCDVVQIIENYKIGIHTYIHAYIYIYIYIHIYTYIHTY